MSNDFQLQSNRKALLASLMSSAFLLAACGGGDGSSSQSSTQTPADAGDSAAASADGMESALRTGGTWTKVADEKGRFTLTGTRTVRYGKGSTWMQKTLTGSIPCTNSFFGKDPLPHVVKECDVLSTAAPAPAPAAPAPAPAPAPSPAPAPAPAPAAPTTLAWSASSDTAVTGYRVYYGTASGTYLQAKGAGIATGKTTTYSVSSLTSGKLYYFAVTATDSAGHESAFSNEVTKLIP